MERRDVVKGFLGMLGSAVLAPFAFPARARAWGAISGIAPTHQHIVQKALDLVSQDPSMQHVNFPFASRITDWDYVTLSVSGKDGPGPDMDGRSPFSWHYYNPLRETGEAPFRSASFFLSMLQERSSGQDNARSTAWGAHFLADMFVPYHVVGTPANEAHDSWVFGNGQFDEIDTGPPDLLYSLTERPPAGWGLNGNFSSAVTQFCQTFPLGSDGDWFDPWYLNGRGGSWFPETAGVADGSHGSWELWAWQSYSFEDLDGALQATLRQSYYDPLWANARASFEGEPWQAQAGAVEAFARACAGRTRQDNNFGLILQNPPVGIAAAVRGVATWLRASLTSLRVRVSQEAMWNGGYRLFCHMENANPREQLTNIEIRMVYNLEGRWFGGVSRYEGVIGASETGGMTWDFPDGRPIHGTVEVIGQYSSTPDLGYVKTDFSTQASKEEIDPEVLATWKGVWTLSGTDLIGPNAGNTSDLGSMEITVEGTRAWFKMSSWPDSLPMRVVDNGTCVEFDWRNEMATATGRMCMSPDRNSYTGVIQGEILVQNAPWQADLFGRRIREDED